MSTLTQLRERAQAKLRAGDLAGIRSSIRRRWGSSTTRVVLRRDLQVPFEAPPAKVPLTVAPLTPVQRDWFLRLAEGHGVEPDLVERAELLRADLGTCYAATDEAGTVAYVQWLLPSALAAEVQQYFRGYFDALEPDEVLLEGAYTFPSHRGMGVMSHAMAVLAVDGLQHGDRYAVTYVEDVNIASMKGCQRAGFAPYRTRRDVWQRFRSTVSHGSVDG